MPDHDALLTLRRKVRHDEDISMSASALFADVCDMHEDGGCWAKDQHFASRYDVHEKTAARWRRELQRHGYLRREPDGGRVYLIPNLKLVGGPQNHGAAQENEGKEQNRGPQNDGKPTNPSPQNRGTQRDNIPADAQESAGARERGEDEQGTVRESDPDGVRIWAQVTGERPCLATRRDLKEAFGGPDAPRWDTESFRKAVRDAWLNVGREAGRIRIGYLLDSYEQRLARSGDTMPDPDVEFNARGYKIQ